MSDLLSRLDALRAYLRAQRDATRDISDPIMRERGVEIIDGHLDALDDACELLQVN